jgi:hypothetical protein
MNLQRISKEVCLRRATRFVLTIFLSLSVFVRATSASEADAIGISQNIRIRHMPFGTILDPIFASAASDQIVGYTHCGDSAIWTGHYLAAEAFRYAVTGWAEALDNVKAALRGISALLNVTGTNLLARCLVPINSPYAEAIIQEEASNGIFENRQDGWYWIGDTSRDQYSGVFFGLGVAYDLVDDADVRTETIRDVTLLLDFLRGHNWSVPMPNGKLSTTFIGRADQELSFLQVGRHVNSGRFSTSYDLNRFFLSPETIVPISIDVLSDDSYFKFNVDSINLFNLIRLEHSSFGDIYRTGYDILRRHTDDHGNAYFNIIDRALNGPNEVRDSQTRKMLDDWLFRPRRDVPTDLRGMYPACGSADRACEPIPVAQRVPTDFLWQRSPFQLVAQGTGMIESAGIDYILPYWMARYYGVLD